MTDIVRPRFIALDSSQLGMWAYDRASPSPEGQRTARLFEEALAEKACLVFLSWHHFEELLAIEDEEKAGARLELLAALPLVGWVRRADGEGGPGTIVDILAAEALVASSHAEFDARAVRDTARSNLVCTGTGSEATAPFREHQRLIQRHLWKRMLDTQAHVAVTTSPAVTQSPSLGDVSRMKMFDLLNGRIREAEGIARQLAAMRLALQRDVALHGDPRIDEPDSVAAWFGDEVDALANALPKSMPELSRRVLELMGIRADEIDPEATFGDVADLMVFRRKLGIAAESAGVPIRRFVDRVRIDQVPSAVIGRALEWHAQPLPRRYGSDFVDRQLACLAPYADLTYVDKRTKENLRRASAKDVAVGQLIGRVEKVRPYLDALDEVGL